MKESILLVEDERQVARAVARTFRLRGVDVVVIPSVSRGRILRGRFSIGIFDIDLEDGSGVELARELLAGACVGQAVFFSASADAEVLARAAKLGAVVAKREGTGALVRVVSALIRPRQSLVVGPPPTLGNRRSTG